MAIFLALLLLFVLATAEEHVICVHKGDYHYNECDFIFSNLSLAFNAYGHFNHTKFMIYPGTYTLPAAAEFNYVTNVAIEGTIKGVVVLDCDGHGGLSFHDCSDISLMNISFQNCGVPQTLPKEEILNATLCFVHCSDISLQSVNVVKSIGLSLLLNGVVGYNSIFDSHFIDNVFGVSIILQSWSAQLIANTAVIVENCTFEFTQGNKEYLSSSSDNIYYIIGGGLQISVGNNVQENSKLFMIHNCQFSYNSGIYGGGIFLSITDNAADNIIEISNTLFIGNNASQGGGGVRIQVLLSYEGNAAPQKNNVFLSGLVFTNNSATFGGGLSLSADYSSNQFVFTNSEWTSNVAMTGSAIVMSSWALSYSIDSPVIPQPFFINCSFHKNVKFVSSISGTSIHSTGGTLYIESVSVHFKQTNNFTSNVGTPIYAINGNVNFEKDSRGIFVSNVGTDGGALSLIGDSALVLAPNVTLNFTGNSATGYGSAIYVFITRQHKDLLSYNCFVRYNSEALVDPNEWNVTIMFRRNRNILNDSIFSTDINFCMDNNHVPLFCTSQWNFGPGTDCRHEVKTLPALIQFKSPYNDVATSPGNVTLMNLVASDDNNNTVKSYFVIAQNTSQTKVADYYRYISDDHIRLQVLSGLSFSNPDSILSDTVVLRTSFPRILEVRVPVVALPCPPGFTLNNSTGLCECNERSFGGGIIRCLSNFTALIRTRHWIGYFDKTVVVGRCRFCASHITTSNNGFITLPSSYEQVDDALCGGDKKGVLCTSCQNASFALNILNFECIDCGVKTYRYTWILIILTQLLPVIVLFVTLLLTNFHLASGSLNGAIFFAQTITTSLEISGNGDIPINSVTKSYTIANVLLTLYSVLYSIWNLDFIEPIKYCLAPHLSINLIFVWEYAVALLPMLFVGMLYLYYFADQKIDLSGRFRTYLCCLRHCRRLVDSWKSKVNWKQALRNILSSCIILAYTRCTLNTLYILNPTPLQGIDGHVVATVPYFDGSTRYGHQHHVFFMICALCVFLLFLLPVPLMLLFCRHNPNEDSGQTFRNVLLDSFQRDFKSPARLNRQLMVIRPQNMTRFKTIYLNFSNWLYDKWVYDRRWVPGLYFILRVALSITFVLSTGFLMQAIIQQMLAVVMAAVFLLLRPYKSDHYNRIDGFIFLLIIVINSISMYQYALSMAMEDLSLTAFIIQYILVYIPMLWIAFVIIRKIASSCKRKKQKKEYEKIDPVSKTKYGLTVM